MIERSDRVNRFIVGAAILVALLAGIFIPMITDEAYYVDWATRSAWPTLGFFDHPPFVSWLAGGVRVWHQIFAARIMVWLSYLVSVYYIWKTAKILIPSRAMLAVVLVVTSIGGIASGFLLTPDTGLIVMWSIAIHEAVLAIRGDPRRWLSAGLATGIGLLSKYTMVLIGPVFLWGMIRDARKQLWSPWPYLGGIVCALVFAPHVWWQSQNNWVTFRFQFGHGFSIKQAVAMSSLLPNAKNPETESINAELRRELFEAMGSVSGFAEAFPKPKPEKSKWEQAVQYTGDFAGGVAALWGVYSIAALLKGLRAFTKKREKSPEANSQRELGMGLIEAGAFFPLIFFGALSPFTKIEANWPAMHMAPLAIWVLTHWTIPLRLIMTSLAVHIVAISSLIYVLVFPETVPFARKNRLLLESKGYRALGEWVMANFPAEKIAVDSYQLKSAIRYYAPATPVVQWPGITRGSEYTRGDRDDRAIEEKILYQPKLTVISMNSWPQVIPGFNAESFSGIRVCPDGRIGVFNIQHPQLPCEKGLREWWITTYRNDFILQNPR